MPCKNTGGVGLEEREFSAEGGKHMQLHDGSFWSLNHKRDHKSGSRYHSWFSFDIIFFSFLPSVSQHILKCDSKSLLYPFNRSHKQNFLHGQ